MRGYYSECEVLGCGIDDEKWDAEILDEKAQEMEFMKNCSDEYIDWLISTCR